MMILDEMDDYVVYDDVVMNLYDELYDDIYIYIIPRMNVLLFFGGDPPKWRVFWMEPPWKSYQKLPKNG